MLSSIKNWLKQPYKVFCALRRDLARKTMVGYYPVLLEYPMNPQPRYGHGQPPHERLYRTLDRGRERYAAELRKILSLKERFFRISQRTPDDSPEPCWINRWFPGLDAVALYSQVAVNKPPLFLEIGSGTSTKFARRAARDFNLKTRIISIDPQPRAEIDKLCDEVIRLPLEKVDPSVFSQLHSGDILFFDGSHYCFQNSDVTTFFLEIMPSLPPGVIVELHDITLPYDYPPEWKERYYNEQYLLAVLLLANPDSVEILSPNAFISSDAELSGILADLWAAPELAGVHRHGGSFWFRSRQRDTD